MLFLQSLFLLSFGVSIAAGTYMLLLRRDHPEPGIIWWVVGCYAIGATLLLTALSQIIGLWALRFVSHITIFLAFSAFWIGFRYYLGIGVERLQYVALVLLTGSASLLIFWFWKVDPSPQVRLTINSVVLLWLSLRISQSLFAARIEDKVVVWVGLLYIVFAFLNGFRCVNIILFPSLENLFGSGMMAKVLTALLLPVILVAMLLKIVMIRQDIRGSRQGRT